MRVEEYWSSNYSYMVWNPDSLEEGTAWFGKSSACVKVYGIEAVV